MSDQFSSLTFTPFIAILLRLTCLIYQEGIKFIERITLEHINPSVDTNIKDSYQINKAYRNKVQEIKDYASKLKVDLKTQKLVLVHALKTKTSMSYKEISDLSGQVKVSTLSQQNKRLRDKAILEKELARLLISVESL